MKYALPLALLVACDNPEAPPRVPATPAVTTTPDAPTPEVVVVAATPVVTPQPPTRLHVAFEGRCGGLGSSIIGDQMFVHYREVYPNARTVIARLGPDARPAERVQPPRNDLEYDLTAIEGMAGRWPNQLYARIGTGERGGYTNSYIRFEGTAWTHVEPFARGDAVLQLYPWHSGSILAVGAGEDSATRLAVIRGAPKAPKQDAVRAALGGCVARMRDVAVLESGPLVGLWSCFENDTGLVAARFTPDDLKGTIHALLGPTESAAGHLAHDGKDTVYVAVDPVGKSGAGRLFVSTAAAWVEQPAPPSGGIRDLDVHPDGALWLLQDSAVTRRSGDAWVPEDPGLAQIIRLVGVDRGRPWAYGTDAGDAKTKIARRADDGRWERIELPHSALFPDQALEPWTFGVDAGGDLWIDASYSMKRRSDKSPKYRFNAVLTSRPVTAPMRCGETLGKPMTAEFADFPTGVDARCKTRLVLLQREVAWKDGETYAKLRKALRGASDVGAAQFSELEVGGDNFVAALVDTDAAAQSLLVRARKVRSYAFPEVLCGDPAILERAGVRVRRPLPIDLASGELRAPT